MTNSAGNLAPSPLFDAVTFPRGAAMPNRFMLAPLTNQQSHPDGTLSDEEFRWLTMRATGGFGLVMTCASHVQAVGQGFAGQLGCFDDRHLEGLTRLAQAIQRTPDGAAVPSNSHPDARPVGIVQLHHAGNRAPADLIGTTPVCPSDDPDTGARALTEDEVQGVIADFVAAAVRSEQAGFDGVELHGAHGYLICQFLSSELNHRTDAYGGSLENRSRLLFEIIDGVRAACGENFILGVRLSPERFGMVLSEIREVTQRLVDTGLIDFVDLSLWDCFKEPEEAAWKGRTLTEAATGIERRCDPAGRAVPLAVAGKIHDPADAERVLALGADVVALGRVAILHHDYPQRLAADTDFTPNRVPVTREYLSGEGLSEPFIDYMAGWKGFVAD